MFFGPKTEFFYDNVQLYINGGLINHVTEFKFLGILLDNKLTFQPQVLKVIGKLSSANYLISKCKRFLPKSKLVMLYIMP